jgi:hypothetical protein
LSRKMNRVEYRYGPSPTKQKTFDMSVNYDTPEIIFEEVRENAIKVVV